MACIKTDFRGVDVSYPKNKLINIHTIIKTGINDPHGDTSKRMIRRISKSGRLEININAHEKIENIVRDITIEWKYARKISIMELLNYCLDIYSANNGDRLGRFCESVINMCIIQYCESQVRSVVIPIKGMSIKDEFKVNNVTLTSSNNIIELSRVNKYIIKKIVEAPDSLFIYKESGSIERISNDGVELAYEYISLFHYLAVNQEYNQFLVNILIAGDQQRGVRMILTLDENHAIINESLSREKSSITYIFDDKSRDMLRESPYNSLMDIISKKGYNRTQMEAALIKALCLFRNSYVYSDLENSLISLIVAFECLFRNDSRNTSKEISERVAIYLFHGDQLMLDIMQIVERAYRSRNDSLHGGNEVLKKSTIDDLRILLNYCVNRLAKDISKYKTINEFVGQIDRIKFGLVSR